jgi:hypothetical protein
MAKNYYDHFQGTSTHEILVKCVTANSRAVYRECILARAAAKNMTVDRYIWEHLTDTGQQQRTLPLRTQSVSRVRDLRPLLRNIRKAESIVPACQALMDHEWDRSDPALRMTKMPEEIDNFLQSQIDGMPKTFNELPESMQRLLMTIIDSYFRWMAMYGKAAA